MPPTSEESRLLEPYLRAYPDDLAALCAMAGAKPVPDELLRQNFDKLSLVKLSRALEASRASHTPASRARIAARCLVLFETDRTRLHFSQLALALGDSTNALHWSAKAIRALMNDEAEADLDPLAAHVAGKLADVAARASLSLGDRSSAVHYAMLRPALSLRDVDFVFSQSLLDPEDAKLQAGSWHVLLRLAGKSAALRILLPDMVREAAAGDVLSAENVVTYNDYWRTAVFADGRFRTDMSSGASAPVAVRHRLRRLRPARHFPGTTLLVHNTHGAAQFYHWMIQILPRLGLALRAGVKFDRLALYDTQKRYVRDAMANLNIPESALVDLKQVPCFSADRVVAPLAKWNIDPPMVGFVRSTYLPDAASVSDGEPLYISRNLAQSRRVVNEDEMMAALSREFGFRLVRFEEMTLAEQARVIAGANCVVAPHGAGLSNICFCRPDTLIVEIMKAGFNRCYNELAHTARLRYRNFDAPFVNAQKDMAVDVERLVAMLKAQGLRSSPAPAPSEAYSA